MYFSRSIRGATMRRTFGARFTSTKRTSLNGNGAFEAIYQTFMKNNVTYVGTIIAAAVLAEGVYGGFTNFIWESYNRGRLYHHIDWTQFKSEDEEEEEEEDDE